MSTPFRIWVLRDGVPGHVNQAQGLVRRIATLRDIDCTEHFIPLRMRVLRPTLRWGWNRRKPWAAALTQRAYGRLPVVERAPDLIVSAGGNTSFANAMLSQRLGCDNFYMGSLRGLDASLFSGVFSLQPLLDNRGERLANNVVMPILPPNSDVAESRSEAQQLRQQYPNKILCAVLLGGNGSGYRFSSEDWQGLGAALNTLSERHNVLWLLTTSRRTGVKAEQLLQGALDADTLAEPIWYGQHARNRNAVFLQAADCVLCGEDSMSMLHEALAVHDQIAALAPRHVKAPLRYVEKINQLIAKGYVQRCSIAELDSFDIAGFIRGRSAASTDWANILDSELEVLLGSMAGPQVR